VLQPLSPIYRYSLAAIAFCAMLIVGSYLIREGLDLPTRSEGDRQRLSPSLRGHEVWFPPPYRLALTVENVEVLPPTAIIRVRGHPCYFVDVGCGWYALRLVDHFVQGEAVVTDGAFLLKSELLR
jgi:hypothetical protein